MRAFCQSGPEGPAGVPVTGLAVARLRRLVAGSTGRRGADPRSATDEATA